MVTFQMAFQLVSRGGHLPGGCDGRIDQQPAAPQLDRRHAHVDVHICARQLLRLLECPDLAAHHLT